MNNLLSQKEFVSLEELIVSNYKLEQNLGETIDILKIALERGFPTKVIPIIEKLINIRVDFDLFMLLGEAEKIIKNYPDAYKAFLEAKKMNPNSLDAIFNLGLVNYNQCEYEQAIECFNDILTVDDSVPEAHYNLGNIYRKLNRFGEAEIYYKNCCQIMPKNAVYHYNLGVVLEKQFKFIEALECYNKAVELDANFVEAHWNKALNLLANGDYQNGWSEYEWRLKKKTHQRNDLPFKYWNNEVLNGKKLLIYDEQGFGDTIQFLRFVPQLKKKYSVKLLLECKPEIFPLIEKQHIFDEIFIRGENIFAKNNFDYKVSLLSLASKLHVSHSDIPIIRPYIKNINVENSQLLANGSKIKIGIVWNGNTEHENDKFRSIKMEELLSRLSRPDISFYSLQKGSQKNIHSQRIFDKFGIIDLNDRLINFYATANLISELDLIISVDTSVAHLAGAMMKPVWILLPANPDWRWGFDGSGSIWYPSAKLFRQKILGNWDDPLDEMVEELSNLVSKSMGPEKKMLVEKATELFDNSEFEKAAHIFENIINSFPPDESIYNNLAICYQRLGLNNKAIENCYAALKIAPDYANALNTLSINYYEIGKINQAIETLENAVEKKPEDLDTIFNLGNLYHKADNYRLAKKYYEKALRLGYKSTDIFYNLALLLIENGNFDEAKYILAEGLDKYINDYSLLFLSANIEQQNENYERAEKLYLASLKSNPGYLDAYLNLAKNYYLMRKLDSADNIYRELKNNGFDDARVDFSMGVIFQEKNYIDEAEKYFRKAIAKDAENADFHVALSEILFSKGEYKNGWDEFEWRFNKNKFFVRKNVYPPNLSELSNKAILIYEEQGIGDTFQFLRFVKKIKTPDNCITFAARSEIKELVQELNYIDEVIDLGECKSHYDYIFSVISLAKYFINSTNDINQVGNYLSVADDETNNRNMLNVNTGYNVGICWRGNSYPVHNRKRHSAIEDFSNLFLINGVNFYCLQKDISVQEKQYLNKFNNVIDLSSDLKTFKITAEYCSIMDLVISVDTAILHLAGALGKYSWALLPYSPDWRWKADELKSNWYANMRLFRQKSIFNWDQVFKEVEKMLRIEIEN